MKICSKKRKLLAIMALIMTISISGCSKSSESQEEALTEERIEEITEQNDLFTDMRFEAEYEWYNEFIYPIKEQNWNVSQEEIKSILEAISQKREEVNGIKGEDVKAYIEYKYGELTKETEDKKLKEEMDEDAQNVDKNIAGMNEILDTIEKNVRMGMDGKITSDEAQSIENSFEEILKIYETEVK